MTKNAALSRTPAPTMTAGLLALLPWLLLQTAGCAKPEAAAAGPPKPPEVTVAQPLERAVTDHEEFTGRTEAPGYVEIRPRVSGYLNEVHFRDGDEVETGKLLFEIDPRPFEAALKHAEGDKAQWIARRDKANADVARYERLVPTGAASAQDLDKARAEMGEAVAAIESADATIERAQLDLEFSKITAPIDGQIGRALITKGNLVQPGAGPEAMLTTIVSIDPMYCYFGVNERTLLRLREAARARTGDGAPPESVTNLKIPVFLGLANETDFPHQGVIDFADNQVDPSTGTIRVRAVLDNGKRVFKPGLFARLRIPVTDPYQALLISQFAVGTDQGQKYVLTVNDQNLVERRFVRLGPQQDDGLQVVLEGLKPGEWIVVNGLQRARPGKPVTPQRGEMPRLGVAAAQPASQPAASTPAAH